MREGSSWSSRGAPASTSVSADLAAACVGWFVAGMGVLLIVPYRPNRYLVPLLPPLAVLAGLGFAAARRVALPSGRRGVIPARTADTRGLPQGIGSGGRPPGLPAVLAAVLALALVLPGIVLDAGWMASTPTTLPGVEARVAALVPVGAAVQGDLAPVLAMRTAAQTIVSRPATNVNAGDLYVTHDVRWVFTDRDPPGVGVAAPGGVGGARPGALCDVGSWSDLPLPASLIDEQARIADAAATSSPPATPPPRLRDADPARFAQRPAGGPSRRAPASMPHSLVDLR